MSPRLPRRLAHVAPAIAALAELPAGSVVAVTGKPRSGKTTAVQAADRAGAFPRRVVFDPYAHRDARLARLGEPVTPWDGDVVTVEDLLEDVVEARAEGRPSMLDRRRVRLVVTSDPRLDPAELAADFSTVADLVWSTGRVDLIAEEVGLYGRKAEALMNRIGSGCGHAAMRFVTVVQSVGRLHIDARKHINVVVAFSKASPTDLDFYRAHCSPDFVDQVRGLKKGDPPAIWLDAA